MNVNGKKLFKLVRRVLMDLDGGGRKFGEKTRKWTRTSKTYNLAKMDVIFI